MIAPPTPPEKFRPNPKLKLREQLGEVMRFKHFSHRTESAYWHWMRGFILFHQTRHPQEMGGKGRGEGLRLGASARRSPPRPPVAHPRTVRFNAWETWPKGLFW